MMLALLLLLAPSGLDRPGETVAATRPACIAAPDSPTVHHRSVDRPDDHRDGLALADLDESTDDEKFPAPELSIDLAFGRPRTIAMPRDGPNSPTFAPSARSPLLRC